MRIAVITLKKISEKISWAPSNTYSHSHELVFSTYNQFLLLFFAAPPLSFSCNNLKSTTLVVCNHVLASRSSLPDYKLSAQHGVRWASNGSARTQPAFGSIISSMRSSSAQWSRVAAWMIVN